MPHWGPDKSHFATNYLNCQAKLLSPHYPPAAISHILVRMPVPCANNVGYVPEGKSDVSADSRAASRSQYETRMKIVDALENAFAETPISKVKVGELCRCVGISRTVFYRYFHSINDVPRWLWECIFDETAACIGHGMTLYEGHLELFRHLERHRDLFARAMRDGGIDGSVRLIARATLEGVTERAVSDGDIRPTEAELLQVRFFNEGAVAMTQAWLTGDLRCTPEALSECFMNMVPRFWEGERFFAARNRDGGLIC